MNAVWASAAIVAPVACDQGAVTPEAAGEPKQEKAAESPKGPLVFDVSKILYAPVRPGEKPHAALPKSASIYYTFWAQIWIGVYYIIKDYSLYAGNDRVRIINLQVTH